MAQQVQPPGPVQPRRLDQGLRYVLERGEIDDDAESGAAPQRDGDQHQQSLLGVGQEALRRDPERESSEFAAPNSGSRMKENRTPWAAAEITNGTKISVR